MTKPYAVLEIYEGKRIVLCVAKEVNGAQTPNMNRADPATKGRSWEGMKVGVREKPQRVRGQRPAAEEVGFCQNSQRASEYLPFAA